MALTPGARLGPYEITAQIGAGGMGEVYQARDLSLGRLVAVKVLPDAFAQDPERLARFEREAKTLASLNHPNIATIHGLERANGVQALVMELVEGPTLADRIAEGALPLEEALPVAKQIADALEGAHEKGIIHRDLKPANIKLRPDGTVKVLDFGLAKALTHESEVAAVIHLSHSPTITSPAMTAAGVILGTAAYMSPEQAKGRPADRRSDLWAFGCVLYEMLSGHQAFAGDDVTETLAAIVRAEPDWSRLPSSTPPSVRRLLRRSLEKNPKRRLADACDARLELEDGSTRPSLDEGLTAARTDPRSPGYWRGIAIVALALLAGALIVAAGHLREQPVIPPTVQFTVAPPSGSILPTPGRLAASLDGRRIAFAVQTGLSVTLMVRDVSNGTVRTVPSSDGITSTPFWSPDSRSIAFVVAGKLRRVDVETGVATPICDLPVVLTPTATTRAAGAASSGTWNATGDILFAVGSSSSGTGYPLFRVSASGGKPTPATALDVGRGETEHALPDFLSDGQHFLFLVRQQGSPPTVFIGSLAGSTRIPLLEAVTKAMFAAPDHVVYVRDGVLYRRRLDLRSFQLTGEPVAVTNDAQVTGGSARGVFTVSATGLLAFENTRAVNTSQFTWYDRSGRELGRFGQPGPYEDSFSLTPDGQRLLSSSDGDIWLLDARLGTVMKVADNPVRGGDPVWAPDGLQFLYSSWRHDQADIFKRTLGDVAHEDSVLGTDEGEYAEDWSPDGRYVALMHGRTITHVGVLALADHRLIEMTSGTFQSDEPHFSPDGRFLAYNSDESGNQEIYVQPFPPTGGKWIVSTGGGVQPRWRRDGRELFYLAPNGDVMAVGLDARSATLQGAPTRLFQSGLFSVRETVEGMSQ